MNTSSTESEAGLSGDSLLKIQDVARYLNVSERHVRNLMSRRRIAYMRLGGSLRFDLQEVKAAAARMRIEAR